MGSYKLPPPPNPKIIYIDTLSVGLPCHIEFDKTGTKFHPNYIDNSTIVDEDVSDYLLKKWQELFKNALIEKFPECSEMIKDRINFKENEKENNEMHTESSKKIVVCTRCNGKGYISKDVRIGYEDYELVNEECFKCLGTGRRFETITLEPYVSDIPLDAIVEHDDEKLRRY